MARLVEIAEPFLLFSILLDRANKNKKKTLLNDQKEREGFEPSIVLNKEPCRFSRPELSTTQPSLQKNSIFILFLFPRMEHGHMSFDTITSKKTRWT